ncbi:lytic transglycosylase domain-containing protein [Pseudoruegeria sp. SK021]|uniref:lytic transglycosylase domain-containing protein n=1 Tax=Pseudoruegeria sp. SK021 TaxID=1933035 RepID=UPI000A21F633|nr:lytic transglycosylase domain-containing protein [Pseudoruegeria sp. SK021]OSP53732.1 hypothetical protein BV911_16280 [Pseudoruegeria sp. SK021]
MRGANTFSMLGVLCGLCMLVPTGAAADLSVGLKAAAARDWPAAVAAVQRDDEIVQAIIEWQRLRAGDGDFADYLSFIQTFPHWPGMPLLRMRGEDTIPSSSDPALVLAYFAGELPQTGYGILRFAAALEAVGQPQAAQTEAIRAWRSMDLDAVSETTLLAIYGEVLAAHHVVRADNLLWTGQISQAERMRPRVPPDYRAVMDARIALRTDAAGVDGFIAVVPDTYAGDPGLAFERAEWRARKGRTDDVLALYLERSATAEQLGRPEAWAPRRRTMARSLMRDGRGGEAYLLAAQHHLTEGNDFADLEWLAGYIALRKLDNPPAALSHFRQFRAGVQGPISLGRAGYWEGRAHEAMDQPAEAAAAYGFGAEFQVSFYGQLAAKRAGVSMDPLMTGGEVFPDYRNAAFTKSSVYLAGVALDKAGDLTLSGRFFAHLAESLSRSEIGQLAAATEPLNAPYIQLQIAKRAAEQGHMLHRAYFPMMTVSTEGRASVSPELALAIARRESEFHPAVVSPAGARGLMQVMPGTASDTAKVLGLPYSRDRLTEDPAYNAQLGTAYLQKLVDEFGPSIALVSAGYNAGPGRSRRWIDELGDPRQPEVDVVDWIEAIPFRETQNYIMRVSESLDPYRARQSGKVVPLTLTERLTAR